MLVKGSQYLALFACVVMIVGTALIWSSYENNPELSAYNSYYLSAIQFDTVSFLLIGIVVVLQQYLSYHDYSGRTFYKHIAVGLAMYITIQSPNDVETVDSIQKVKASDYRELLAGEVIAYIGAGLSLLSLFVPAQRVNRKGKIYFFVTAVLAAIGAGVLLNYDFNYNEPASSLAFYICIPTLSILFFLAESVFSGTSESANAVIVIIAVYNIWILGDGYALRSYWDAYPAAGNYSQVWVGVIFCW